MQVTPDLHTGMHVRGAAADFEADRWKWWRGGVHFLFTGLSAEGESEYFAGTWI